MKLTVALYLIAAVAAAPPTGTKYSDDKVQILRFENEASPDGSYKFGFELTDGQSRREQGQVINAGLENEYVAVQGVYSWIGPDGVEYIVRYTANDKGFQPVFEQRIAGESHTQRFGSLEPQLSSLLG